MARRSQKPAELNLLARIRTGYIDALGRKETYQPITACDKRVDMKNVWVHRRSGPLQAMADIIFSKPHMSIQSI